MVDQVEGSAVEIVAEICVILIGDDTVDALAVGDGVEGGVVDDVGVVAGPAIEGIRARAAGEGIVAAVTDQRVVAVAAVAACRCPARRSAYRHRRGRR